jgi:hypothetical protein
MEGGNGSSRGVARVVTVDLAVAALVALLGAIVVYESYRLGSRWGEDGPQAGYFPFYVGGLVTISGIVLFVQALLRLRSDTKIFVEWGQLKQVMIVLLPTLVYILCAQLIGIYVSATAFIALFMRLVGKYGWLRSASVGLGVGVASFLLFEVWFKIPLPKGPLESWLGY